MGLWCCEAPPPLLPPAQVSVTTRRVAALTGHPPLTNAALQRKLCSRSHQCICFVWQSLLKVGAGAFRRLGGRRGRAREVPCLAVAVADFLSTSQDPAAACHSGIRGLG